MFTGIIQDLGRVLSFESTASGRRLWLDLGSLPGPLAAGDSVAISGVCLTALEPLDVHPRTSLTIVEQLRHNHYLKKPLDDEISSRIFDKYMEMLDGGKSYFLASDIAELEKYRFHLDDALKRLEK